MNLTTEQHLAIETRAKNVLVSASAGSGKTFVLVRRIIELIKSGQLSLDRCLIVTFTNAAAAEMRERIAKAIVSDGSPQMLEQLKKLHYANISTLHAFCKDVISAYYYIIDLAPNMSIASQQLIEILFDSALDEVLESAYEAQSEAFIGMMARYSSHRSDDAIKAQIKKIYYASMAAPDPQYWLDNCRTMYAVDRGEIPYLPAVVAYLVDELKACCAQLKTAQLICLEPAGPLDYKKTIDDDLAQLTFVEQSDCDFEMLYRAANRVVFTRLATIKKANKGMVDERLQARVKLIRSRVKKTFDNLTARYFARPLSALLEEQLAMKPSIDALLELVQQTAVAFRKNKMRENVLDFNDLEQYAIEILSNEAVAQYYRAKFDHIFVDEYQDSNRVQETIVNLIKRADNLFLVGDVKQSIYRFRMAEPKLFLEKFYSYPNLGNACRIDLNANFRTHPDILAAINDVFKGLMTKSFGGLDYAADGLLQTLRKDFRGAANAKLFLVDNESAEECDMDRATLSLALLAKRVRALTEQTFSEPEQLENGEIVHRERKFRYGDIVILLRSVKSVSAPIRDYFSAAGIPLLLEEEDNYFDLVEVATLINFLKVIDNPLSDIALLAVLRSYFGDFSDAQLAAIGQLSEDYYFEALKRYSAVGGDAQIIGRIERFLAIFDSLRAKRHMPVAQFICYLLDVTAYRYYVLGLEDGVKRVKHIDVLLEKAEQFESERQSGLHHFVDYLDQLKRSKINYGGKANTDDATDAVRIMSIHKSKGLEFPAVIVANVDKRFNLRDSHDKMVLHADLGIVSKWIDPERHLQRNTLLYEHLSDLVRTESVEEEQRLLYVAMTRAVYHLELHGIVNNVEKKMIAWQMSGSPYQLSKQTTYLDWLMSTLFAGGDLTFDDGMTLSRPHFDVELLAAGDLSRVQLDARRGEKQGAKIQLKSIEKPFSGYRSALPARLSVSDLKRQGDRFKPLKLELKDSFSELSDGRVVGNIYHKMMENLTFAGDEVTLLAVQLSRQLSIDVASKINLDRIRRFVGSALYSRICRAEHVYRERSFVYNYQLNEGSQTTVQGVVDLMIIEQNQIVVIDYKSDRVDDLSELECKYRGQLDLYATAMSDILDLPVAERIIYSIYLSDYISW